MMATDEELFASLADDNIDVQDYTINNARNGDKEALFDIGRSYYNSKMYLTAVAWYRLADLQNHEVAQNELGYMYDNGLGVPKNYNIALTWYLKAAKNGSPDAHNNIGHSYQRGSGVEQNFTAAMEWYQKAESIGAAMAQNQIGYLYQHGLGVTRNLGKAIDWFLRAANNGNELAPYNLGWVFEKEEEAIDLEKAKIWYKKAADLGDKDAIMKLQNFQEDGDYIIKYDDDDDDETSVTQKDEDNNAEIHEQLIKEENNDIETLCKMSYNLKAATDENSSLNTDNDTASDNSSIISDLNFDCMTEDEYFESESSYEWIEENSLNRL